MLLLIGALIQKKYVFKARNWELEKIESIDFFDSFGSSIYVQIRGTDILRIIPKINIFVNNSWISDRVRFFFDSLYVQVLNSPFIFNKDNNEYYGVDWLKILNYFDFLKIFYIKGDFFNYVGRLVYLNHEDSDLLNLISFRNFFLTNFSYLNTYTYSIYENYNIDVDFMTNYCLFNFVDFINSIENNNFINIFLFGYNIRCEHPLFFFKLNEFVKKKKIKIYIFGVSYGLVDIYQNIGVSLKDFLKFFYSKILFKYKNPSRFFFFIGSSFLNRTDFNSYSLFFKNYFYFLQKFNFTCSYKYIYYNMNDLNLLYMGYKFDFRQLFIRYEHGNQLVCAFSHFNFINIMKSSFFYQNLFMFFFVENDCNFVSNRGMDFLVFKVFFGHNVFSIIPVYDVLLPITFLYERDSLLLNIFGFIKKNLFVYLNESRKKDIINIYKYMEKNSFNKKLCNNIEMWFYYYNKVIFYKLYDVVYINFFEIYGFCVTFSEIFYLKEDLLLDMSFIYNKNLLVFTFSNFLYSLNNFYQINTLTKLSSTLLLASKRNFFIEYDM